MSNRDYSQNPNERRNKDLVAMFEKLRNEKENNIQKNSLPWCYQECAWHFYLSTRRAEDIILTHYRNQPKTKG